MKNSLFVLSVFFFLSAVSLQAQQTRFGVKAGVNFASISGDDTEDLSSRTGLHLGAVMQIPFSERFSFQGELLYTSVGAKFEESEDGFNLESIEKLNYIALPILAKFYAAPGFSLEAGPQAAFLVSAKNETTASFEGETETETEDIAEFISTFDLAFALGAAYELENGLFFSARYNLGISNIVADAGGSGYSNQNSVIQLSAGFMFN